MTGALALYEMSSPYPELAPAMLTTPALELRAAWIATSVWEAISAGNVPLLTMVWSAKPTMVHPSHVAALGDEIGRLIAAQGIDAEARTELASAQELCVRAGSAGHWIVSIGP